MPLRQRRSGYQPGRQLSPALEAAIDAEAVRLAAIENPAEAVTAVAEVFIALDDAVEAILDLYRTSRSYQSVATATATGFSKARVAQPVRKSPGAPGTDAAGLEGCRGRS